MKLLMAMSSDGFLAKNKDDDMKWTGKTDKQLFWLLTQFSAGPLLIGERSAEHMPSLFGRRVLKLNSKRAPLQYAAELYSEAILLGGPNLAKVALDLGMIDIACIIVSPAELGSGMAADFYLREVFKRPHTCIVTESKHEARIYKWAVS